VSLVEPEEEARSVFGAGLETALRGAVFGLALAVAPGLLVEADFFGGLLVVLLAMLFPLVLSAQPS
jgi:hypothetical protein